MLLFLPYNFLNSDFMPVKFCFHSFSFIGAIITFVTLNCFSHDMNATTVCNASAVNNFYAAINRDGTTPTITVLQRRPICFLAICE